MESVQKVDACEMGQVVVFEKLVWCLKWIMRISAWKHDDVCFFLLSVFEKKQEKGNQ